MALMGGRKMKPLLNSSETREVGQNNGVDGRTENETRTKTLAELEERVEKQEDKIQKLESNVFQLANYYFVFQGIILTAIIKVSGSTFGCQHVWLPFLLCLIGAILNFGTLLVISQKYKESLNTLDTRIFIWYQAAYPNPTTFEEHNTKYKNQKKWRKMTLVSSMVLFFIFAVVNLVGIIIILC